MWSFFNDEESGGGYFETGPAAPRSHQGPRLLGVHSLLCGHKTAVSSQPASVGLKQGRGKEEKIGACFLRSFPEAPPNNWAQMLARLGHKATCIIEEAGNVFRKVH